MVISVFFGKQWAQRKAQREKYEAMMESAMREEDYLTFIRRALDIHKTVYEHNIRCGIFNRTLEHPDMLSIWRKKQESAGETNA